MSEPDATPHLALDLERYPLDRPGSDAHRDLVARGRSQLAEFGLFDLPGFVRPEVCAEVVGALRPLIDHHSFTHRRRHNIYFLPEVEGLAPDHPALALMETSNRTVCADQVAGTTLDAIYRWAPMRHFLAELTGLGELYLMDDPLAPVNVMSYRDGEALNWHFDRSQFTTTVLLQAPLEGGEFEFRTGLRDDKRSDHEAIGRLVAGQDPDVQRRRLEPGTLSVFTGRHTAHRVAPVVGPVDRVIAVFSYFTEPGVTFTPDERLGFYGRSG